MIKVIYIVIITYFVLGGVGFYLINKNKAPEIARKSYTKFGVYFLIINILFFSIVVDSLIFRYLALLIIVVSLSELVRLYWKSGFSHSLFFFSSLLIFSVSTIGFYHFSGFDKTFILFSFLVLSIFDSFSQITGQLWGSTKILPDISPNKTLGGLVGGALIAIASGALLSELYGGSVFYAGLTTTGIVLFAFLGDVLASLYKRKYKVKDYSNLIPGHGGFLDRFDSLIMGGAWVAFSVYILDFN